MVKLYIVRAICSNVTLENAHSYMDSAMTATIVAGGFYDKST